jgi:hypothetical protein
MMRGRGLSEGPLALPLPTINSEAVSFVMGSVMGLMIGGMGRTVKLLLLSVVGAGLMSACTVDVGPDTGPPQPCNAPTPFFVTDVWPQYFATYNCGQSSCHDASTGRGFFRLENVSMVTAPMPMDPLSDWPIEWSENFSNVQQNVSCSNPTQSLVLVVPSGESTPHPPGTTVTNIPAAQTLFTMWLQ